MFGLPKKLLRRSVDRNQIKRLARESFRSFIGNPQISLQLGQIAWMTRLESSLLTACMDKPGTSLGKQRYRKAFDELFEMARLRLVKAKALRAG